MLDIDDTADTVHGHQQLSLFNAHYDERCSLPIHVNDAATGHCPLTILCPGIPRMEKKFMVTSAGWSGASAGTGRTHGSRFVATFITGARR